MDADDVDAPPTSEPHDAVSPLDRPELPDDYYVRLLPVDLALVSSVLDRVDIRHARDGDAIRAGWPDYVLAITVPAPNILSLRAEVRRYLPASMLATVVGRCNWWNSTRYLGIASARTVVPPPDRDPEDAPTPALVTLVHVHFSVPCGTGMAPVQVQEVVTTVRNLAHAFVVETGLDKLRDAVSWT